MGRCSSIDRRRSQFCLWFNYSSGDRSADYPVTSWSVSPIAGARVGVWDFSVLLCSTVAAFIPAVGEYAYRNINPAIEFPWLPSSATSYVADVLQLRTDAPVIPFDHFQGVITFPSFHASLGVLFLWAFWRTPVVRWIALILNGALIAATPIFGGHYFVDVAAGMLLAFGSILIAQGAVGRLRQAFGGSSRGGDQSRNNPSNEPARLAHINNDNKRAAFFMDQVKEIDLGGSERY